MTSKEYNTIVEEYADSLFRFLLKNTREYNLAKDLVQQSFEKLWNAKEKVIYNNAKSYLFKIGYNCMIDHFRKQKRIVVTDEVPETYKSGNYENFELQDWIELGLSTLTEQQRSLILLRDYEGYSYKEIGEITDLNESQVKVYIFRARKCLKNYFLTHHKQEMKSYGFS